MKMLRKPVEDIIREEIETVRARRIILDQLEGGLLTGAELREKITTDIKAQMVADGASKREIAKVKVTSPKLYHNTKRLEELGIIVNGRPGYVMTMVTREQYIRSAGLLELQNR